MSPGLVAYGCSISWWDPGRTSTRQLADGRALGFPKAGHAAGGVCVERWQGAGWGMLAAGLSPDFSVRACVPKDGSSRGQAPPRGQAPAKSKQNPSWGSEEWLRKPDILLRQSPPSNRETRRGLCPARS